MRNMTPHSFYIVIHIKTSTYPYVHNKSATVKKRFEQSSIMEGVVGMMALDVHGFRQ